MKQFLKNLYNNKFNNFAFSLIELSIVLIIMGLLISGVMGGQNLIENAKINNLYNNLNQYKQALYTFYSLNERLPGDFNLDNRIGYLSGETIKKEYFKFPYDGTNIQNKYYLPNEVSAPFVELYQNGLITWEPQGNEGAFSSVSNISGIKNLFCYYHNMSPDKITNNKNHYFYNIKLYANFLQCQYGNNTNLINNASNFAYKLDKKYDDGSYNSGNFRAACGNGDGNKYEIAILNNDKCKRYSYIVWSNI